MQILQKYVAKAIFLPEFGYFRIRRLVLERVLRNQAISKLL